MAPAWSLQERIQALEKEEEKKVRATEKRLSAADIEKRTAIAEVDRLQRFIIAKDMEVNKLQRELIGTRQLYWQGIERARKEARMQNLQRIMSLGRGRAITGEQRSTEVPVRALAPKFTPTALCFMPHGWDTSGHLIRECALFVANSNRQRVELLFQERCCYGASCPSRWLAIPPWTALTLVTPLGAELTAIIRSCVVLGKCIGRGADRSPPQEV